MRKIRAALAQINPTVGDIEGNVKKIVSYIKKARTKKADIVIFPELAVTGYPPEDLLMKPHFIQDNIDALKEIEKASKDITVVVGFIDRIEGLYNAAAIVSNNMTVDVYHKINLPNYGVFDEHRYFIEGKRFPVYNFAGINIGVNICEDIWTDKGPVEVQALMGADLIVNINASPFHAGKASFREDMVRRHARECKTSIVYVNMVGGQDELVFDGGSFVADDKGETTIRAKQFDEELIVVDIELGKKKGQLSAKKRVELKSLLEKDKFTGKVKIPFVEIKEKKTGVRKKKNRPLSVEEEIYGALLLGTKDYVLKSGFKGVVIGMSGGIDSALTATIAVDALGKENVCGIFMPSKFTSKESYEDASVHAKNLGIKFHTVPIDDLFGSYNKSLAKHFKGQKVDITEENLQARIRGNILMAFSNKFGWMVLTTGNKSEMSVGYATLYGDMAGGFAVIKDVPKTIVYKISEWRNKKAGRELIPGRILWKEPTAELKPDQKDSDSLPPYSLLDPIIKAYVEEDKSFEEILELGCEIECAQRVISMIDHSEYKRRQAPPGVKITPRAFGKDRRFPITNRYKSY